MKSKSSGGWLSLILSEVTLISVALAYQIYSDANSNGWSIAFLNTALALLSVALLFSLLFYIPLMKFKRDDLSVDALRIRGFSLLASSIAFLSLLALIFIKFK